MNSTKRRGYNTYKDNVEETTKYTSIITEKRKGK